MCASGCAASASASARGLRALCAVRVMYVINVIDLDMYIHAHARTTVHDMLTYCLLNINPLKFLPSNQGPTYIYYLYLAYHGLDKCFYWIESDEPS